MYFNLEEPLFFANRNHQVTIKTSRCLAYLLQIYFPILHVQIVGIILPKYFARLEFATLIICFAICVMCLEKSFSWPWWLVCLPYCQIHVLWISQCKFYYFCHSAWVTPFEFPHPLLWLFETIIIYWIFYQNVVFYLTRNWKPSANNQIC